MALSKRKTQQIQKSVEGILQLAAVTKPPIPVERIAQIRNVEIRFVSFEGEISGLLAREGGHIIIGVNATHPRNRQRFTIAHELGHLELDHLDSGANEIHVDRHFKVMLRDERSSDALDPMEIQANAYAAELLMPASMLSSERELRSHGVDLEDDLLIRNLAQRYRVSTQAMTFRLSNLAAFFSVRSRAA